MSQDVTYPSRLSTSKGVCYFHYCINNAVIVRLWLVYSQSEGLVVTQMNTTVGDILKTDKDVN